VGVYPECHPQAVNLTQDLDYFKAKVDAGADFAITQYFYNADAYFHLLEECARRHITIPIIPGIMPIYNFSQLSRFSEMCGAEIPRYMRKTMEGLGDDVNAIQDFGVEVVSRLCATLLKAGVPGLHFYTLNKYSIIEKILKEIPSCH
jgi:methylenetetrahydrofolate reductase (NADPH)